MEDKPVPDLLRTRSKNTFGKRWANFKLSLQLYTYKLSMYFDFVNPSAETKAKLWYKIFDEVCLSSSMPKTQKYLYDNGFVKQKPLYYGLLCIDVILRGVAQVFLCNHPLCGLLVLIGLSFTSMELPLYALLGTTLSTFSAVTVARPPEADILAGLCGYDGALVGCACLTFFGGLRETITATVLMAFLSGIVHVAMTNLMKIWQLPSFTFAFNIVTIMLLYAVKGDTVKLRFAKSTPVHYAADWTDMSLMFAVDASIRGVGQFMFADTTIGSSFVVAGITLCSRKGAAIAVLGSIVGWIIAFYILDTTNRINIRAGIYGYNCAGTCCVLAGGIFYPASGGAVLVGVCGAALAALLHQGLGGAYNGVPVLTFPFILSAWMLMLCRSKWLEITSDGILRPLMKRMSTTKMPNFSLRMKPHPNSRNNSNVDAISRLRSRLDSFTSSGKLVKRWSSSKIAIGASPAGKQPSNLMLPALDEDLEEGRSDGKRSERGLSFGDSGEQQLFHQEIQDSPPPKPLSFKNVAKALVDLQREMREEQQLERQQQVHQQRGDVQPYEMDELVDVEDL